MKTKRNVILKYFIFMLALLTCTQFISTCTSQVMVYAASWGSVLQSSNFSSLDLGGSYYDVIENTTKEYDYGISTFEQLKTFRNAINSSNDGGVNKVFKVTAQITVDSSFQSIGASSTKAFRGSFVGGGLTMEIKGLTVPLFNYTKNAVIRNVEISNSTITYNAQYVGGIVCNADNTKIEACRNNATVQNTYENSSARVYTGGIVGYAKNSTTINQCSFVGNVESVSKKAMESYVGGIVGKIDNGYVKNCYVIGSTITAKAKTTTLNKKPQYRNGANLSKGTSNMSEDNSLYYSTTNKLLEQAKNEVKNKIAQIDAEIANLKKQWSAANFWGKIKIAAQIVAKEGEKLLYKGGKLIFNGIQIYADSMLLDRQYLNNYKDSELNVEAVYAYTYGIGYSEQDNRIIDCYTANTSLNGGYEKTTYKFHLKFWAQAPFTRYALYSSDKIDRVVEFNTDLSGPISNKKVKQTYYLEKIPELNRYIYLDNKTNVNWYNDSKSETKEYSTWGNFAGLFGSQKIIFESNKNTNKVKMYVNNRWGSAKTLVIEFGYYTELQPVNGTTCKNVKSTLTTEVKNKFNSSIWSVNSAIENGFPHLKYRYW